MGQGSWSILANEQRRSDKFLPHDEGIEVEWVVVHHDSASITYNLKQEAAEHADHKAPCFVFDAEE